MKSEPKHYVSLTEPERREIEYALRSRMMQIVSAAERVWTTYGIAEANELDEHASKVAELIEKISTSTPNEGALDVVN